MLNDILIDAMLLQKQQEANIFSRSYASQTEDVAIDIVNKWSKYNMIDIDNSNASDFTFFMFFKHWFIVAILVILFYPELFCFYY